MSTPDVAYSLVPATNELRADLAWLVHRRLVSLPLNTWPVPSTLLSSALASVQAERLTATDAEALGRVRRVLQRSSDAARGAARVNSARHPKTDGPDPTRGVAEAQLSGHWQGDGWAVHGSLQATADPLGEQNHVALDGSYMALFGQGAVLAAGALDRWWGPALYNTPLMSDAAPPAPTILLRNAEESAPQTSWLSWIGPWGYELSLSQLQDYSPRHTRTIGLRLYARPFSGLEIGAGRHIMWGGEGRPQGLGALTNALLGQSNVSDVQSQGPDPSNEIAGLDARLSFADPWGYHWAAYLHMVGEDEAGNLPSRHFGTVGLQVQWAAGGGRVEAGLETSDTVQGRLWGSGSPVPAPAYRHHIYTDGYYQQGLPMGAAIGGGGRAHTAAFAWTPNGDPAQRRYAFSYTHAHVSQAGAEPINQVYGDAGMLNAVAASVQGETASDWVWHLGVSAQHYGASSRHLLGVQMGIDVPLRLP